MPKLTIITIHKGPIINLKKTLNSVSNQNKYPNEQIIISPKLPKYIKDNYNKKFLKFIIGKDKSIYNAMNIGLRLASSENILFLNRSTIVSGHFWVLAKPTQTFYVGPTFWINKSYK